MKTIKFRKGDIVICSGNVILVTGQGDKKEGYPVFAGVVIAAIKVARIFK